MMRAAAWGTFAGTQRHAHCSQSSCGCVGWLIDSSHLLLLITKYILSYYRYITIIDNSNSGGGVRAKVRPFLCTVTK